MHSPVTSSRDGIPALLCVYPLFCYKSGSDRLILELSACTGTRGHQQCDVRSGEIIVSLDRRSV